FYDYYIDTLTNNKSKYFRVAGSGYYDKLSAEDVEDVFSQYGTYDHSVPVMFDADHYEEILYLLQKVRSDTGEIPFHMEKIGNDFDETHQLLAQWLGFKQS